ncbi:MAG TPA: hypothetical protein VEA69_06790 [Tepidisphaeraceae bacterium]|nr:hypothetical protein [Tepidisphaeraceae bacterium]
MIRGLIKLGTLALAGYAVYSLYDIFSHGAGQSDRTRSAGGSRANPIPDFGTTVGGARMTGENAGGGGTGMSEQSHEATGTMASHRVGRGVL